MLRLACQLFWYVWYPCTTKQTGQTILNAVRGLSGGECVIAALHASMKFYHTKRCFTEPMKIKIYCHIVASPTEKVVWPYSTYSYVQNINHFTTHFSSSNDLFCFSALARTIAPVSVRSLSLRLQWSIIRHELASYPGHVGGGKSGLVSTVCACANHSGNLPRTSPIMDKLHVVVMRRNNQTRYTASSVAAGFHYQSQRHKGWHDKATLQPPPVPPSLCLQLKTNGRVS